MLQKNNTPALNLAVDRNMTACVKVLINREAKVSARGEVSNPSQFQHRFNIIIVLTRIPKQFYTWLWREITKMLLIT